MLPKRGFFLGACAAVIAGADARALLSESNSVQASVPVQDLGVCSVCKSFVTEGEEYINDPETLDQVSLEIKKLCEGEGDNAEMVRMGRTL
ncbi:hypothetical protein N8152_02360 [bacterium]|jgi:hypothetical protein|nr:hypothetical protein [bacterium]|tara:strand:- start:5666 stop:5938 length:273 start_codon:yes stop_codon:yes gene_type:complete